LLDDVLRITGDPETRADVNSLLSRIGLRIGLTFRPVVKGKKRIVQRLASGRLVFGNAALPVPQFGKDNTDPQPAPHVCRNHDHFHASMESDKNRDESPTDMCVQTADNRNVCDKAGEGTVPIPVVG
jgi:hypothetical protein